MLIKKTCLNQDQNIFKFKKTPMRHHSAEMTKDWLNSRKYQQPIKLTVFKTKENEKGHKLPASKNKTS